jgi:hypothetical protein
MVATSSLARHGNRKHEERKADNIVVDEDFTSCEQNGIWPITNGLQKMLKWSTTTANA